MNKSHISLEANILYKISVRHFYIKNYLKEWALFLMHLLCYKHCNRYHGGRPKPVRSDPPPWKLLVFCAITVTKPSQGPKARSFCPGPLAPIEWDGVSWSRGRDFFLPQSLPWVKGVYMLLNSCLFLLFLLMCLPCFVFLLLICLFSTGSEEGFSQGPQKVEGKLLFFPYTETKTCLYPSRRQLLLQLLEG